MTESVRTMLGARPDQIQGRPPSKAQRAELIARMVSRVRRRNYFSPLDYPDKRMPERTLAWIDQMAEFVAAVSEGPTIDATPLWGGKQQTVAVDECECLFTPWTTGSMFTVNPDGKGIVGTWFWSTVREDYARDGAAEYVGRFPDAPDGSMGVARSWDEVLYRSPEIEAVWDEIAQVTQAFTWIGGPQNDGSWGVVGPWWQIGLAVDFDGKLRATDTARFLPESVIPEGLAVEMCESDVALMLLVLDFLNLRNIEVAEMSGLPKPVRKRLAREDVTVSELTVLPTGKYRRHDRDPVPIGEGSPLTSVRGHIIRSGVEGRKHLFGRENVTGRFWVPAHARGSKEHGEVIQEFIVGEEGS